MPDFCSLHTVSRIMARRSTFVTVPKMPKGFAIGIAIGLLVLFAILGATCFWTSGRRHVTHATPELVGPLSPGVTVRDMGSSRSKCMTCEEQAGAQGGKARCLTCTQPSFRYLTETIIAEQGADRACRGCVGNP